MGLRARVTRRKAWRNDTGNQRIYPLSEVTPTTLAEIQEVVREAERDGCTVRAVGSGHSWSDVALTDGILVKPTGLASALELEAELMRAEAPDAHERGRAPLVRVEAGMTIAQLNAHLRQLRLALPNMGGFDGQTVAGVISTSTHGSGLRYGPLSDLVRSLDIVGPGGTVHRIESHDGPTDPDAYRARHPDRLLRQDDRWFRAAVVGMGCMGLIYSVILEVQPMFYLRERRSLSTWSQVRDQLARGGALDRDNVHYEVYFNPYPRDDGEIECLVTTRNPVAPSEYRHDHRRSRSLLMELTARFPLTPTLINLAVGLCPKIAPFLIRQALKALVNDDYVNISYRVFNIGAANYLPAYSCEIGVPVDERQLHVAAVEKIVEVAGQRRHLGDVYHTSPISLRFVKATDAYMSMMQGADTMMIELIMANRTVGGMELLNAHENALYALGGRPHWGQLNSLTGSHGLVAAMYPRYQDWQEIHAELNASGVFDSPFSKRVGISSVAFLA
jgi:D-arabinono-1,4-lactone oxidase/FAD binding domain-containing protein